MKKFFVLLLSCLFLNSFSQDLITLKNGEQIEAVIVKTTDDTIEYRKFDNQVGPIYSTNTEKVLVINYANGTKDVFNSDPEPIILIPDNQPSQDELIYKGHDFEYYNKLHKKYKYKSVKGIFYTFTGIGLAGLGTIVTIANNYTVDIFAAALFVGGFLTFNIGLPSWAANAAKAKANKDAMDYINNMNRHGFDISLGITSNGIGVIVSF